MIIHILGSGSELDELSELVNKSLRELALDDAVSIKTSNDEAIKMELGITQNPALAIEEESIDFKDMIFEGEVPEYDEIKSMFISILGDDDDGMGGCSSGSCGSGGCSSCETGC